MLDLAHTLFVEQGYEATTVEQVANEIGMSKNTIYARYPNKEALFLAVVERIANSPLFVCVTDNDDLSLEEGLVVRARAILQSALQPAFRGLYRLLLLESERFPEVESAINKAYAERLGYPIHRYIVNKVDTKASYRIELDRAAYLFMTTLNAYVFDYTIRPAHMTPESIERNAREAVTFFLHGGLFADPSLQD